MASQSAFGIPPPKKKESVRSENEADKERLHELPYREIVKSGTIRPASGFRAAKDDFESDQDLGKWLYSEERREEDDNGCILRNDNQIPMSKTFFVLIG